MKKLYYLFIIFFASAYLNANDHAYGGIPSDNGYLERAAYIIEFDYEHKISRQVAYHVKPEYLDAPEREGKWDDFRNDPDITDENLGHSTVSVTEIYLAGLP